MRWRTLTEPLRGPVLRLNKPACCGFLFWRTTITVIDPAYTQQSHRDYAPKSLYQDFRFAILSASIVHPPASVGAFSSRATPAPEKKGQLCFVQARKTRKCLANCLSLRFPAALCNRRGAGDTRQRLVVARRCKCLKTRSIRVDQVSVGPPA